MRKRVPVGTRKRHIPKTIEVVERNWVVRILTFRQVPFGYLAVALGILTFLITLGASARLGDAYIFLRTAPFYASSLVVLWVTGSVYWGLKRIPARIEDLKPCFDLPSSRERDYDAWAAKWVSWFSSNKGMLATSLVLFLVFASVAVNGILIQVSPAGHHFFPDFYYTGDRASHLSLILLSCLIACLGGGCGPWLFVINVPFIFQLRRFKVRPFSCGAYFIGVGITAAILLHNFSTFSKIFLILVSVIGSSAFLLPQFVFHHLLLESQDMIASNLIKLISDQEDGTAPTTDEGLKRLMATDALLTRGSSWVLDGNDLIVLALGNIIPSVFLYIKQAVPIGHV